MSARFPHGARLRSARKTAGLSVEQAAVNIGRTAYTVTSYELGHIEPPLHVLAALTGLYGTTVGAVLDEQLSPVSAGCDSA